MHIEPARQILLADAGRVSEQAENSRIARREFERAENPAEFLGGKGPDLSQQKGDRGSGTPLAMRIVHGAIIA
jgi:hypothetical protein